MLKINIYLYIEDNIVYTVDKLGGKTYENYCFH
nr:MAG TPA: hypothetical protein [Caudoviricetes sp.]